VNLGVALVQLSLFAIFAGSFVLKRIFTPPIAENSNFPSENREDPIFACKTWLARPMPKWFFW